MFCDQGPDSPAALLVRAADERHCLPCRVYAPDLWFGETPTDVDTAKRLCAPCPVRGACLEGALRRREPWGVWGGQIVEDGVVIPYKRRRGRPRTVRPPQVA